jgi:hypothetical protein
MTYKILLIFALLYFTLSSCSSAISDRIQNIDFKNTNIQVDTFPVHKKVSIDLETRNKFHYGDKKILILINSTYVVFYGTYSELKKIKIPLPKANDYSENSSEYLVSVEFHDIYETKRYKWASDELNYFDENKMNLIKLLYTGNPEESVTLKVEQIE